MSSSIVGLDGHINAYLAAVAPHADTRTGDALLSRMGDQAIQKLISELLVGNSPAPLLEADTQAQVIAAQTAVRQVLEDVDDPVGFIRQMAARVPQLSGGEYRAALWALNTTPKTLNRVGQDIFSFAEMVIATLTSAGTDDLAAKYQTMVTGKVDLALRGSAKSRNGKLLEGLVLSTVLRLGGFTQVDGPGDLTSQPTFCLSDAASARQAGDREADATVRFGDNVVKIDVGFLGNANPEVISDKLSRFHSVSSLVLVDSSPSEGSTLLSEAERLGVPVVAMSYGTWLADFYSTLAELLPGYSSPFASLETVTADDVVAFIEGSDLPAPTLPPEPTPQAVQLSLLES